MTKNLNIHLVSDFSVYALRGAITSALIHFPKVKAKKYYWPLVKDENIVKSIFEKIESHKGIVIYNISNKKIRKLLKEFCIKHNFPYVSLVGTMVEEIADYLDLEAEDIIDLYDKSDDKLSAIEFAVAHDDGQNVDNISNADIILIGPSRSSKTPTSFYLAYNGFKTANVPYILGNDLPENLYNMRGPLIVGLIIDYDRLMELRETRMGGIHYTEKSDYLNIDLIKEECRQTRILSTKHNWPLVDVTRRSIEETAALITKFFYDRNS